MIRKNAVLAVGMAFVCVIGILAYRLPALIAACDNKGASESVGACMELGSGQYRCESAETANACGDSVSTWFEVKQDFPTSCVEKQDYNCNTPLEKCRQKVECEWVDGKCQMKPGSGSGVWVEKQKKTSVACSTSY